LNDERRTPPEVFDPLNRIFRFDLDPCTTPDNPLRLERFYTKKEDGLIQPWGGKAFVNCPYSRGGIEPWVEKAEFEEKERNTLSALLLPADHSTGWYKAADALCWSKYRIPFRVRYLLPDGSRDYAAKFPSIVFFIGGLP